SGDMGFLAGRCMAGSRRLGWALILAAIIAALIMAVAASAQAAPNTATAWGLNQSGQLGYETTEICGSEHQSCSTTPMQVSNLSGVTAVGGGEDHSLALLESRTVMAWGSGSFSQLGDGATEHSS